MERKSIPIKIGKFGQNQNKGFFEYESSITHETRPSLTIRVQRAGYFKNEEAKKTVESFLQNFYKYFKKDVAGTITIYTVAGRSSIDGIYITGKNTLSCRLDWSKLKTEEDIASYLSDLVIKRMESEKIPFLKQVLGVFKEDFFERMKPKIMAEEIKE